MGFTLSGTVPHYDVSFDGKPLIVSSALGLEAEGVNLSSGFSLKKVKRYSSDSWYDIPWGENKH